jgi:hypothetical protein
MTQDLLDLLALQKIKSEKEAAARQMQMQMAQQQAAQGEPPTVAQQREQEVMQMTKDELAKQRGDTADQQVAQQQAAMQKLMGGIAGAPGAGAAAQPMAMASGGIVAFAGPDGSQVGEGEEDPRLKRREGESFSEFRRRRFEVELQIQRERNAARTKAREEERMRRLAERGGEIIPPSPFLDRAPLPSPAAEEQMRSITPPSAQSVLAQPPSAVAGQQEEMEPPPPPMSSTPAPSQQPGLAGLPAAQGNPAAPVDPFTQALKTSAQEQFQRKPQDERQAEEARIRAMLEFPEERQRRRGSIDQFRGLYEQDFDPERQRREGIRRFLLGAGGRRYNEFGGGAQAALDYDDNQRKSQLNRLKGMEEMEQGLFSLTENAVKGGIGAGRSVFEQAETGKRTGITAGQGIVDSEKRSADAALDRDLRRIEARLKEDANKIAKEGVDTSRAQTLLANTELKIEQRLGELDKEFAKNYGMLIMAEQAATNSKPMDPAKKNQLEVARAELEMRKNDVRKRLEPILASARTKLGIPNIPLDATLSESDRQLLNKYKGN